MNTETSPEMTCQSYSNAASSLTEMTPARIDVVTGGVLSSSLVPLASPTKPARLWKRRAFIPGAMACTTAAFLGWRSAVINNLERRQREAFQKLQGQVRFSLEGASTEDLAAMKLHRANLVRGLQPHYQSGLAAVPQVGNNLGSFSDCFHILVRQAMDMVRGTSSAQEYIVGRMGRVAESSSHMQGVALSELGSFSHEVGGRVHQLAAKWLQGAEQLPAGAPGGNVMQPVAQMIGSVDGHLRELNIEIGFGAFQAGLAAFLNRQLLIPLLRPYAEKAAALVGTNIALAVSDGPLPFGEIIGILMDIGFGLWTAWGIFWLSRELPGKITHSLSEGLNRVHDEALAQFDRHSARILSEAAKMRKQAAAPLLALNPSQLTTPQS